MEETLAPTVGLTKIKVKKLNENLRPPDLGPVRPCRL